MATKKDKKQTDIKNKQGKKFNWFERFFSDTRKIKWSTSSQTFKAFATTIAVVVFFALVIWGFTAMVTAILGAVGAV